MRRIRDVGLKALVGAVAGAFAAAPAWPMSVGNPEVTSFLGQPLRMRVPVTLDDLGDAAGQCVRLINSPAGDVPGLTFGRVELERAATTTYLRVSSPMPIGEPILRVAVEIGCIQRVRREFTLFLDPPPAAAGPAIAEGAPPVPPRIEFGPPEVIGYRGQPLLVNVPLGGEMVNSLTEACVRPGRSASTEPPRVLNDIRVALIDRGGDRSLRIHTPDPVDDARVRVIVEVGCDRPIRREFALQIEPPRLAEVAAGETAFAVAPAPGPRRPAPAARPKLPPVLPPPPAAPAAPPPVRAEAPPETQVPPIQPAQLPPREPPSAGTDRLVLAPAEETPRAEESPTPAETPAPEGPTERERAVLKQVEELAAEVKKLRAELEASSLRNRELAQQTETGGFAWISAVAAVLLLGLGFLIGSRGRPRATEARIDSDRAGPMTRILGQKTAHRPAPVAAPVAAAASSGAAGAEARRQPAEDTQGASTAIMVTEFGDTTQVLGELYSPYIGRGQGAQSAPPTQPAQPRQPEPAARTPEPDPSSEATTVAAPPTKTEIALDLDLGQERPSILSPQTKTEIAVDIDLFERNSQIGRDLQREYERLDLLADKSEAPPESKPAAQPQSENEPPTIADSTTAPLTTKLELDLDLSTIGQSQTNKPKKPE